jgi:hypothetical protein
MQQDLAETTASLIAEFAGLLPAETVIRCISRAREQLLRSGVRAGLAVATESKSRMQLLELLPAHRSVR